MIRSAARVFVDVVAASAPPRAAAPSGWRGSCRRCRARCRAPPRTPPIVGAEVGRPDDAEAADQPGAQIRDDVAVEIRQHQHVELLRVHHQLHARGVDDPLVVGDVGEVARRRVRTLSRNSPSLSFMMLALWIAVTCLRPCVSRVLERELRDPRRRLLGDDLQALDDARARPRARARRRDPRCSRGR